MGSMDNHSTISEQGTCSATAVLQQTMPLHSWSTAGGVCVRVCVTESVREREKGICVCVWSAHTVTDSQISTIHEARSVSLLDVHFNPKIKNLFIASPPPKSLSGA